MSWGNPGCGTEKLKGKTLSDADALNPDDLMELLGREVVMTRPRCATLALDTLKLALKEYRRRRHLPKAAD